jgi:hypothetical protein
MVHAGYRLHVSTQELRAQMAAERLAWDELASSLKLAEEVLDNPSPSYGKVVEIGQALFVSRAWATDGLTLEFIGWKPSGGMKLAEHLSGVIESQGSYTWTK